MVSSAGTRARPGVACPPELLRVASDWGLDLNLLASHRSQAVTPESLFDADLVLTMTRDHRREVVEMLPATMRRCFTVREFSRLFEHGSIERLLEDRRHQTRFPADRLQFALDHLIASRGAALPFDPTLDDVVDPYGRSSATYTRSGAEMRPGLAAVAKLVRLVNRGRTVERS